MATPNYGYEKRQKELAKKRKKEDKLKEKNERKTHGTVTGDDGAPTDEQPQAESSQDPAPDAN